MATVTTATVRSGFFNAIKNEETGVWDRVYTEEDMTDYLRGVIRQNGVFRDVLNKFEPSKITNQMKLRIDSGKAIVNGHWCFIDSAVTVDLKPGDIRYYRRDYISLRWSDNNRQVTLEYVVGDTLNSTLFRRAVDYKADIPAPIGKLDVDESVNRDSFEPNSDAISGDTVCEIILAYIDVPPGCNDIKNVTITNLVGTHYAPWISYLVISPTEKSVTTYMANLRTQFVEWFKEVQDELVINTNIESLKYTINGNADNNVSTTIHLKNISGYTWTDGDTIMPFYNGLLLSQHNNEYELNTTNKNDPLLILKNGKNYIPADNTLEIVVLKGSPLEFESGDSILY